MAQPSSISQIPIHRESIATSCLSCPRTMRQKEKKVNSKIVPDTSQICLYYFRGFSGLDQSLQEAAFGVSDSGRSYSKTGHTLPVENMHLCIKPVPLPKKWAWQANARLAPQLHYMPIMNKGESTMDLIKKYALHSTNAKPSALYDVPVSLGKWEISD